MERPRAGSITNVVFSFICKLFLHLHPIFPYKARCILFPFTVIYLLAYLICVVSIACTILEFPTRNANSIAIVTILEICFLYLLIRFLLINYFKYFFSSSTLSNLSHGRLRSFLPKMSIGCRLFIDRTAEIQHLNDSCWSQIEFSSYHLYQTLI